jgi:hypothetical protein
MISKTNQQHHISLYMLEKAREVIDGLEIADTHAICMKQLCYVRAQKG